MRVISNLTTAIWLLSRFLNKPIWKTKYYNFLQKPTKNEKGSKYENVTWQWPKKMLI